MEHKSEKLIGLIDMYKKELINQYVFERELADYMDDKAHVKISNDNKNILTKTFGIFVLPELLSDGFNITYIIDKHAILNFYSTEEFALILERLRQKKEKILSKYFAFQKENKENDITYGIALGFLLDLYLSYVESFIVETNEFLPDRVELQKYADKFNTETNEPSDVEALTIKGYLCDEITEFVKKYVKQSSSEGITIKFADFSVETPEFNLGQQRLLKLASSSLGTRDHKEIPYDYQAPR